MPFSFLKKTFASVKATYCCFLLALINKCLIAYVYTQVTSDKALYLLFSKTMIQGNIPLENTGLIDGVPNFFFNGAVSSPLYSFIAVPFLWITKSATTTSIILDCISWFVFISGIYVLGNLLLKEKWLINLFILVAGFFIYPHELNPGPKDTLATGLFCWACVLANSFFANGEIFKKCFRLYIILLSLGLLKYLYMPVGILFSIMLLFITSSGKKSHLWKAVSILILILSTSFYLLHEYLDYLKTVSHATNIINVPEENNIKGFYPDNLLSTYPFIVSSAIDTVFWSVQLSTRFGFTFQQSGIFWKVLEFLAGLTILLYCYRNWLGKRLGIAHKISIGAALSILLITMLASTIFRSEHSGWTFVSDPRFYLFPMLLVQLFFCSVVFQKKTAIWIKSSLLLFYFIGFAHGIYFTVKQIITRPEVEQNLASSDPDFDAFHKFIDPITARYKNIKFASNNKTLRRLAQINNKEVLFFSNDSSFVLNQNNFPLLVAVEREDSTILLAFKPRSLFIEQETKRFLIKGFK